jgi:hypothetical protein
MQPGRRLRSIVDSGSSIPLAPGLWLIDGNGLHDIGCLSPVCL